MKNLEFKKSELPLCILKIKQKARERTSISILDNPCTTFTTGFVDAPSKQKYFCFSWLSPPETHFSIELQAVLT